MPSFAFSARDRGGRTRSGTLDAQSFDAAVADIRGRGWFVLDVQMRSTAGDVDVMQYLQPGRWLPVRGTDVELCLRQLAVMLRSGMTLLDGLRMVSEHATRHAMQVVWKKVADQILSGDTMADSMARHGCFAPVVIQLTKVGEATGELDRALVRSADILERRRKLRNQIVTAMAYPTVVFIAAVAVAAFMVFNVIPKLQTFLQAVGRKLPPITQMLVDVTTFIRGHVHHGLFALVATIVVIYLVRSWPPGRLWTDRAFLWIPIIGQVFRTAGTAAFARNMKTLLQSGVTLLEGLKAIEPMVGNRFLSLKIAHAREQVMQGRSLAEALPVQAGFHPLLTRMIAVGESAGRLDETLEEAATYYEDQLQRSIQWLAAMVEPIMLLVVGGIVGFVYIAFFMALFAAAR